MHSARYEEFSKRVNEALRQGRGTTPVPGMSEERRLVNDAIRALARKGVVERDVETGEITHVDGKPVEDK